MASPTPTKLEEWIGKSEKLDVYSGAAVSGTDTLVSFNPSYPLTPSRHATNGIFVARGLRDAQTYATTYGEQGPGDESLGEWEDDMEMDTRESELITGLRLIRQGLAGALGSIVFSVTFLALGQWLGIAFLPLAVMITALSLYAYHLETGVEIVNRRSLIVLITGSLVAIVATILPHF